MSNDPVPTKVEKTETQFDVYFGVDVVGVHLNDAASEEEAKKQAVAIYKETIEFKAKEQS